MNRCQICETSDNLQKHHISYEPEETVFLCVECHQKVHNHGVGLSSHENVSEEDKKKFKKAWNKGLTYQEIMRKFDISIMTVYNWRKKLGLTKRFRSRETKVEEGKKSEFRVFLDRPQAEMIQKLVEDEETRYRNPSQVIRDMVCDSLGSKKPWEGEKYE